MDIGSTVQDSTPYLLWQSIKQMQFAHNGATLINFGIPPAVSKPSIVPDRTLTFYLEYEESPEHQEYYRVFPVDFSPYRDK